MLKIQHDPSDWTGLASQDHINIVGVQSIGAVVNNGCCYDGGSTNKGWSWRDKGGTGGRSSASEVLFDYWSIFGASLGKFALRAFLVTDKLFASAVKRISSLVHEICG